MEQDSATIFSPGTSEHSLLFEKLQPPKERVRRGNPHQLKPRERWQLAFNEVVRMFVHDHHCQHFQYSTLRKGEFRILRIHPGSPTQPLKASLFKRKLDESFGGYEALSYCWGSPNEKNTEEILIRDLNATLPNFNESYERKNPTKPWVKFRMAAKAVSEVSFPIRRNLHQALVKLRSISDPVNLWVDAICIDQSDRGKAEKEEQLSMMAEIYNSASNVCIWLGDAYEDSSEGIRLVRDIMNLKTFDTLVNTPEAKDRWSHLIQIMKAPWFSRRWIIQEVALARNASIHCTDDVIHWDDFADAVSLLTEKIEILRDKFRDEIFENVEATSACVLVHTLTNVCRKSDTGEILAKLLDYETLVSTLLVFQASFPRDTIYSIMSLARDPPQTDETWELLHHAQLDRNLRNAILIRRGKSGSNTPQSGREKRVIGLTANYKSSTRDLFIAFVTRCIVRSGCLDIICRHWAPPVTDKFYGEEIPMPSWISGLFKAEYGLLGTSKGRQNGENLVAYSPHDRRQRYKASGSYEASIHMVQDPSLDPLELVNIMDTPLTHSHVSSPTVKKSTKELSTPTEEPEKLSAIQSNGHPPNPTNAVPKLIARVEDPTGPPAALTKALSGTTPSNGVPTHTPSPQSFVSTVDTALIAPKAKTASPVVNHLRIPTRKSAKAQDVELEHELSGILAVKGFVLGTVTECSNVMKGGIIPGDWIYKMGWDKSQYDNRVPDILWRLLVANRTHGGGEPPQWYKRSCLHGLVDSRVTDSEGNLHSVTPEDGHISEMMTKYFKRVERVVWNRRLFQADTTRGFKHNGPCIGLTAKETKPGDIVCILLGCTVPVVLKEVKNERVPDLYELVGEAYVHGMMDGEAVEKKDLVDGLVREFKLS